MPLRRSHREPAARRTATTLAPAHHWQAAPRIAKMRSLPDRRIPVPPSSDRRSAKKNCTAPDRAGSDRSFYRTETAAARDTQESPVGQPVGQARVGLEATG